MYEINAVTTPYITIDIKGCKKSSVEIASSAAIEPMVIPFI